MCISLLLQGPFLLGTRTSSMSVPDWTWHLPQGHLALLPCSLLPHCSSPSGVWFFWPEASDWVLAMSHVLTHPGSEGCSCPKRGQSVWWAGKLCKPSLGPPPAAWHFLHFSAASAMTKAFPILPNPSVLQSYLRAPLQTSHPSGAKAGTSCLLLLRSPSVPILCGLSAVLAPRRAQGQSGRPC